MSGKLTVENKLNIIDELKSHASLCGKEWETLLSFSCDENQEIRLAVSEVLALFPTEESEKILLNLLNDSDFLVRASACDSLYFSVAQETLQKLKKSARDKRHLVRGYAVLSIGDVQRNIKVNNKPTIDFLKDIEKKEKSRWVKTAVYSSMFVLGETSYFKKLVNTINDINYKNRCFALNLIEQIIDENIEFDFNLLYEVAQNRLKIEKNFPVKQKLYEIMNRLNNTNSKPKGRQ